MKRVEEHKWRLVFSEGLSVVCLDPCPEDEKGDGKGKWCSCYVGLEEPLTELCGEIDVSLEFRSLCTGRHYYHTANDCDCGWEFVVTHAALPQEEGEKPS